jgi:hypothetical protein
LFFLYNCITYLRLRLFFRLKPFPSDLLIPVVSVVFSFLTFRNCGFPSTNHFQSSRIPVSRFYGSRLKKQERKPEAYAFCFFGAFRVLILSYVTEPVCYLHIPVSSLPCRTVPEFIDPVFTKTSPKRSFSLKRKRAFWLVFAKTGSIISGTELFLCFLFYRSTIV